jgi:hypothetical protein
MSAFSFVPDGTGLVCLTLYPAINGWAIFKTTLRTFHISFFSFFVFTAALAAAK